MKQEREDGKEEMGRWRIDTAFFQTTLTYAQGEFWLRRVCENCENRRLDGVCFLQVILERLFKKPFIVKCDHWHIVLPLRKV